MNFVCSYRWGSAKIVCKKRQPMISCLSDNMAPAQKARASTFRREHQIYMTGVVRTHSWYLLVFVHLHFSIRTRIKFSSGPHYSCFLCHFSFSLLLQMCRACPPPGSIGIERLWYETNGNGPSRCGENGNGPRQYGADGKGPPWYGANGNGLPRYGANGIGSLRYGVGRHEVWKIRAAWYGIQYRTLLPHIHATVRFAVTGLGNNNLRADRYSATVESMRRFLNL